MEGEGVVTSSYGAGAPLLREPFEVTDYIIRNA